MASLDKHFAKVVYYTVHTAVLRKSAMNVPEDWNLHKIVRPPHVCRVHQIFPHQSRPTITQYLTSCKQSGLWISCFVFLFFQTLAKSFSVYARKTCNPKCQTAAAPKPTYIKLNLGENVGNFVPAKTPGETSPSGCTRYGYRLRA